MPPLRPPLAGFTLVEALVVLCLVAVLAALAWPSALRLIDHRRLDGAAATLGADLHLARAEAVARNEAVRVTTLPDDHGGHCYLLHTGPTAGCTCANGCAGASRLVKRVALPAGGRVQLRAPATSLHFDPQLGTCTPAGTFVLTTASGSAVHQIVNLMGRVRSCSPGAQVSGHAAC